MQNKYKNIFFDLDKTLWDFDKNSLVALRLLFKQYNLIEKGIPNFEYFIRVYKNINAKLWQLLSKEEIGKEQLKTTRFEQTFLYFSISNKQLIDKISEAYLEETSKGKELISGAKDILEWLHPNYNLFILSNGFQETQYIKLKAGELEKYFTAVFLSDDIGSFKPNKLFFDYALRESNATVSNTIMIGDDPISDIEGAKNAGMNCILFDPENKHKNQFADYKINKLSELKAIF